MHVSYVVRYARANDADGIARVEIEAWRDAYATLLPRRYLVDALDLARCAEGWRRRLSRRQTGTFVIDTGGRFSRIVGYTSCGASQDRGLPFKGEIKELYLLPDYQGRGMGRRLCSTAAARLAADGHKSMCVEVIEGSPSRFFYEALGARLVARARHPLAGTMLPTLIYGWDDLTIMAATPV